MDVNLREDWKKKLVNSRARAIQRRQRREMSDRQCRLIISCTSGLFLFVLFILASSVNVLQLVQAGDQERKIWYDAATEGIEARVRAATVGSSGIVQDRTKSGPAVLPPTPSLQAAAKGVILFVGDGMGMSTLTAARILSGQRNGNTGEEAQLAWDRFPAVALSRTYNMDAQVGESSACATALLCGVKANYETVGLDASGKFDNCNSSVDARVPSIMDWAQERGKSTGFVTTTRVTHATPAALYAHASSRYWEDDGKVPPGARSLCKDIALQLLEDDPGRKINVVLGGGRRHFVPKVTFDPEEADKEGRRLDGRNLIEEWIRNRRGLAARYVSNKNQFDDIDPRRTDHLLGLFSYSHMDFDVDRNTSASGDPSLAEMTIKALRIVAKNPRGYFLFVEGGRIDHAHHFNNAYRALDETLAMEKAVRAVLDEVDLSETLIVVTADHSHVLTLGGLATFRGNPIFGSDSKTSDLDGKPYTTLLYSNGPGHAEPRSAVRSKSDKDSIQTAGVPRAWATHGGEDVPVFAIGPLSTVLFSGSIDQSYIPHAISYAACLEGRHAARCDQLLGRILNDSAIAPPTISMSNNCPSVEPNSAAISISDVVNNDQARKNHPQTVTTTLSPVFERTACHNIVTMSPKLNELLMRSLTREVKDLTRLAEEISSSLSSVDGDPSAQLVDNAITWSWKFPSTPALKVNVIDMLKGHRGTAGQLYILLLELAYDRIHFVLCLLVESFTSKNSIRRAESASSSSTMAGVARHIWKLLRVYDEDENEEGPRDGDELIVPERSRRRRPTESSSSIPLQHRLAFLDESRVALANQLATMTETKVALEKTIVEIRKEVANHPTDMIVQRQNDSETERVSLPAFSATDHPFQEPIKSFHNASTQTIVDNDAAIENNNSGEPKDCSASFGARSLLTPDDDPLEDMTKELLSNRDKIDGLLRQNERISRTLVLISQYRGNGSSSSDNSQLIIS